VRPRWWLLVLLAVVLAGCRPAPKAEVAHEPVQAEAAEPERLPEPAEQPLVDSPPAPPVPAAKPPPPELCKEISGERAWAEARRLFELGPRPAGSPASVQARTILAAVLDAYAWDVETDAFTAPRGDAEAMAANLVARFSPEGQRPAPHAARPVAVAAHYDTRHFSTMPFSGANESASGAALILELARVLAMNPKLAAQVELIFFDASEPRTQFSGTDGLHGSRHFAGRMRASLPGRKVLVLRGVGDGSAPLEAPVDVSDEMLGAARGAAIGLDPEPMIERHLVRVWADHLPLQKAGANVLLLGNFSSPARYTLDDDMRRVNPHSLKQHGALAVRLIEAWLAED
jgi:hypothetical protein